jgi:membrane-bound metal-dependent hydrolase YbcI (DUF457 family)
MKEVFNFHSLHITELSVALHSADPEHSIADHFLFRSLSRVIVFECDGSMTITTRRREMLRHVFSCVLNDNFMNPCDNLLWPLPFQNVSLKYFRRQSVHTKLLSKILLEYYQIICVLDVDFMLTNKIVLFFQLRTIPFCTISRVRCYTFFARSVWQNAYRPHHVCLSPRAVSITS